MAPVPPLYTTSPMQLADAPPNPPLEVLFVEPLPPFASMTVGESNHESPPAVPEGPPAPTLTAKVIPGETAMVFLL